MNGVVKQRAVAIARAMRVLPLLERVRYWRCVVKTKARNKAFLEAHKEFAPPPLWWMHDMYRDTSFDLYWRTGIKTAAAITEKIGVYVDVERPRVADWGCGLARVLRHLPECYQRVGFDYNAAAIDWCKDNISGAGFHRNGISPPLPARNNYFDALYALSVFTHLSSTGHAAWIAEIERVLQPGGVFLGAFHMRLPQDQLLPNEQRRFDAGELIVRGGVKEGSRTYTAHHPESYLRGVLLRNFEILEPPMELFGQTLIVARIRK